MHHQTAPIIDLLHKSSDRKLSFRLLILSCTFALHIKPEKLKYLNNALPKCQGNTESEDAYSKRG